MDKNSFSKPKPMPFLNGRFQFLHIDLSHQPESLVTNGQLCVGQIIKIFQDGILTSKGVQDLGCLHSANPAGVVARAEGRQQPEEHAGARFRGVRHPEKVPLFEIRNNY